MRYFQLFVILFCTSTINCIAEQDTLIGSPPGYSSLQIRYVNGLAVDAQDNVWIAYDQIGLAKYNVTGWLVFDSTNSPLLKNKVLSVACNNSGVWAGTDTGLFNFNGINWNWLNTANSTLPTDTILKLYSPGGNDLYLYSSNGFAHFNGSTWQQFNTLNSNLVDDTVQCIFEDSLGILWVGTKNGLSRFDGSVWQNYTTSNSSIAENNIRSLSEDGNATLFIGTNSYGILIFSNNEFAQIRNYYSNYYSFPRKVVSLFQLHDGSVLHSSDADYYYTDNPPEIRLSDYGFHASDTVNFGVLDSHDRLWRINKRYPITKLWMRDSLTKYPISPPPSSYNDLDINEVNCGMWNNNVFHWDKIGSPRYEVPKGSFRSSVFASTLWVGGLDTLNALHMAAETYFEGGKDFWAGPLDTITASLDSSTQLQYDSIWKVNRRTIDEFITQFNLGNVTNGSYTIPNEILYWPAHGTGNYSRSLAPFVDVNGDGNYNPMNGDYPQIKGDQMLWWVMNDNFGIHEASDGIAMGIEIHCKAYAYHCHNIADSNEAVNYTTFYSFDIINRSDTDYHDVYIGLFVDVDLGNYLDDFVGCNVEHDIAFVYNGDNNDEGISGYGMNPPMLSVAVLNGPVAEPNDSLDNDHNGIVDEPGEHCMMNHFLYYNGNNDPCLGNPYDDEDYYSYLHSITRCGTHFTYGGNGNGGGIGGTNIPTDYFFPGTPYDTGWTEASSGNLPDDRRLLPSSGPFSLRKGERRTIDFAYIFNRDESAPNGLNTSIAKNISDVEKVKRWFNTDSFPCNNSGIGIDEINKNQSEFLIFPNPASEKLTVIRSDKSGDAELEILNILGELEFHFKFHPGRKETMFKTGNLMPGIFIVKLSDGKSVSSKKLVIQ